MGAEGTAAQHSTPRRLPRPRLYEQLADHIADFIEAQGLSPGDRLPPERRLARDLGVSRATLSRALVALEVQGRVEVRHGDGAVVRDPEDALEIPSLDDASPAELRAARLATMSGIARSAAAHPDRTLRQSLLGADAAGRSLDEVWARVLGLSESGRLLVGLDAMLAARLSRVDPLSPDEGAVRHLAAVVVAGRVEDVEAACAELLVRDAG